MNIKKLLKLCPTFGLLLGFCPALAVTTALVNALGMGVAFTFVLVFSNFFVSLLRRIIPPEIRIPLFIIIVVTFVTIVDLLLAGYTPELYQALGIFVPLIVVNCIILGRAEAFAYKNTVWASVKDGLLNGFWFTVGLSLLAAARELWALARCWGSRFWPLVSRRS